MGKIPSRVGSRTESDMRILYLITVKGHGSGGHFHSLNHISQAMGEKHEIQIYTYGTGKSIVLENNPYFKQHLSFKGFDFLTFHKELKKILRENKPDIVHCFDVDAYNIFTLFFGYRKYSIFLNKCGGPNPVYFPLVQNLILFSEENKKWFLNKPTFQNSNIVVIPNRVNPKVLEFNFGKEISKEEAFCFVRIARIGESYKKSIEDSIRLVQKLTASRFKVHLYIIGAIQEKDVADEIRLKINNLPITMITDSKYTAKASDMLYLADAVIATGRGVMEATSLGKPILTPAKNAELPVLVNEENFKQFFSTNFSERNVAPEKCLKFNLEEIHKLINDDEFCGRMSDFSKQIFEQHFSTDVGNLQYLNFYKENIKDNHMKISRMSDLVLKFKTWYSLKK